MVTMFSCLRAAADWASRKNRSALPDSAAVDGRMTFKATRRLRRQSSASNTTPIPPEPSTRNTRNSAIRPISSGPFRRIEEIIEIRIRSLVDFAGNDRGPLKRAGFGILLHDRRTRAAFLDVVDDAFFVDVGQSAQQQPLEIVVARAMFWWTHANIRGLHCRFSRTCCVPSLRIGPHPDFN